MKNVLIILLLFGFFACEKLNITEDSEKIQRDFSLEAFSQFTVNGTAEIRLIQDADNKAILLGYEKEIEKSSLTINEEVLQFENSYANWTKNYDPLVLHLYFSQLTNIICQEPCSIISEGMIASDYFVLDVHSEARIVETNINLTCRSLRVIASGSISGGFQFEGICNNANFVLNGSSNVMAENLICDTVSIVQNSVGNAKVYAAKRLKVVFYTRGDVYYKGNPEIVIERIQINNQSPTGEVIKLD